MMSRGGSLFHHQITVQILGTILQREFSSLHVEKRRWLPHPYDSSTSQFVTAFSGSFLAMVKSGNPGNKYESVDRLPSSWNDWASDGAEMIFNMTSSGELDVYVSTTDSGLSNRCRRVSDFFSYTGSP